MPTLDPDAFLDLWRLVPSARMNDMTYGYMIGIEAILNAWCDLTIPDTPENVAAFEPFVQWVHEALSHARRLYDETEIARHDDELNQ